MFSVVSPRHPLDHPHHARKKVHDRSVVLTCVATADDLALASLHALLIFVPAYNLLPSTSDDGTVVAGATAAHRVREILFQKRLRRRPLQSRLGFDRPNKCGSSQVL